jgi:probable F420-dependent oxidoreductase
VRFGVHLPQYGSAAGAEAIRRAAIQAEELGFADVWVSDHVVSPVGQDYPSPYLFDPLLSLTWAGAVTSRIGLGTSVLVLPQRHPLELANSLASLDALTGGRVTVVGGVGWSSAEFAALDQDFHNRGRRTDEIIDVLRACWSEDPVAFDGTCYRFPPLRVLPAPAHPIPIWIGGSSEAAFARAVAKGDGFQMIGVDPDGAQPMVERVRRDRPEAAFAVSLRTGWDPQGMDPDRIRRERAEFEAVGVQHVVAAPWRRTLDDWLRSVELLADVVGVDR